MKSRVIYIDLLRIAATFGVIVLHVAASAWDNTPITSADWQIMNIYDSLVRWVVPVFVMISGVFHIQPINQDITFRQEIKIIIKKNCKILTVIIFWGIIYNIADSLCKYIVADELFSVYDIIKIPAIIIFGPAWYHLWFLYMLIGLYLLTPIFRRLITNCKQEHIEYFLVLFFIIGTCIPLINTILDYFPILKGRKIFLPVNEFTGYIGYYIAGYYFTRFSLRKNIKKIIYIFCCLSLIFTIIGTSLISLYSEKPVGILYDYLLPNTMFVAYGIFLFFQEIYATRYFSEKTTNIILKLSKNTFGIFLLHVLIIRIFGIIGINTLIINPIISIPLISMAVMFISLIGTLIINKIPIMNKYVV